MPNICWINEWIFFNWIIRVSRSQFKLSKQRQEFYKKLNILLLRPWVSLTLEAHIFITFGFLHRVILITVITRACFTENLWIHFLKYLKTLFFFFLPLVLEKKMTPSILSCENYSTHHTNPGSCLIYSHLFCLICSAKDILHCIFLLNNKTILKNLRSGNQTILQTVTQIWMIRCVNRMQEHLKDHLPHLCLRCSMAVYT